MATTTTTVSGVVPADIPPQGYEGAGFTVLSHGPGEYSIAFEPAFSDTPAVIAAQGGNFTHPDMTDGTVVGILTKSQCTIQTGDDKGNRDNRKFSFIAMGPM